MDAWKEELSLAEIQLSDCIISCYSSVIVMLFIYFVGRAL
jgi:hypothetical protein